MELQSISLGLPAFEYIEGMLRRPKALCSSLRQNVELTSGKITTYLPRGVNPESIHEFEIGGKLPQATSRTAVRGGHVVAIPNLNDVLVERVLAHLNDDDSAFCIFENGILRPHHPAVRHLADLHTLI